MALLPSRASGDIIINGSGGFNFKTGELFAKDITIAGLSVPLFTWAWFGINIGAGLVIALGAEICEKLFSAVFGGKSFEDRMAEVLNEIRFIIREELKLAFLEHDLQAASNKLRELVATMKTYANNKDKHELDRAMDLSTELVSILMDDNLMVWGYPMFVNAAGLRLAVLQERAKTIAGDKKNFVDSRNEYIDFHIKTEQKIKDGVTAAVEEAVKLSPFPFLVRDRRNPISPVYGEKVAADRDENYIQGIVEKIRHRTTRYGIKAMEQWCKAAPKQSDSRLYSFSSKTPYYIIISRKSGKALDVAFGVTDDHEHIQQYSVNGGSNQQWLMTEVQKDIYTIINRETRKALDIPYGNKGNNIPLQQFAPNGAGNQQWRLIHVKDGSYKIANVMTGKVLDVVDASMQDGVLVQQYSDNNGLNQQWAFAEVR